MLLHIPINHADFIYKFSCSFYKCNFWKVIIIEASFKLAWLAQSALKADLFWLLHLWIPWPPADLMNSDIKCLFVRIPTMLLAFTLRIPSQKIIFLPFLMSEWCQKEWLLSESPVWSDRPLSLTWIPVDMCISRVPTLTGKPYFSRLVYTHEICSKSGEKMEF